MPAAPPYYLLGLAVMGGIALSGAAWFGFYSLESPRRRVAASFCAVNAAYALYVLFQALVCSAASLEAAALLLKGQAAAAGGLFVGLVWLDAAFPERRWGGIDWALAGLYGGLAAYALVSPCGYWFASLDGLRTHTFAWGETIRMPHGPISPLYYVSIAAQTFFYLRVVWHGAGMIRAGKRTDGGLWTSVGVTLLALSTHDHAMDFGWLTGGLGSAYWVEWSFPVCILIMSLWLFAQMRQDRQRSDRLRKEVEEREAMYHGIFSAAGDAILVMEDGRFIEHNARALELFGVPPGGLAGKGPADFSPARQGELLSSEAARTYLAQALAGQALTFPWVHIRPDGTVFDVEVTLSRVDLPGRPRLLAIVRDVTERNRMQLQIHQGQKMEAIAMLAGGIAHDFNNILTGIMGYGELLRMDLGEHRAAARLDHIMDNARRAAQLTRQLLVFSRKQVEQAAVLDLSQVAGEFENMIRRLIGEHIRFRLALDGAPYPVKADKGHLEQILMNLAVNARDAMEAGGDLTVAVENVEAAQPLKAGAETLPPGRYVALSVRDSGCGMDAATVERIFEPFFTTKEPGKGTGLGLSTILRLVKHYQGGIEVITAPGRGTEFRVYFPACEGAAAPGGPSREEAQDHRGREAVLLVEDDEVIARVAVEGLRNLGYEVWAFHAPLEAIQALEKLPRIDVLVTDVVLPGMSGPKLAETVVNRRPGTRVLYTSGYTRDIILKQGADDQAINYLDKPYTPNQLAQKIRSVIREQ